MSEITHRLHEPRANKRLLCEKTNEAYVRGLVLQYGSTIALCRDLQLFNQLRRVFIGKKNSDQDRLFIQEMSKALAPALQEKLIDELPRSRRSEVDRWKELHWWARFVLRLRR